MLKVMTIVGTRPELIKMSRVIAEFDQHTRHVLVHTGQNYDYELNQLFFEDLGIRKPDHFLEAVGENAAHTIHLIGTAPSAASAFLADVLSRKHTRAVDALMRGFGCDPEDESFRNLHRRLLSDDEVVREAAVEALGAQQFFCASDFPHEPTHEFIEAVEAFRKRPDLPEAAKANILYDNPKRLYRL